MEFRSVHQLNADIATWSESLPRDVDLVVGIPRSGMLAATMLALHLHLPLADLDGLLAGRVLGGGRRMEGAAPEDVVATARRILVVDDSTNRGGAMKEAQARVAAEPSLAGRVVWGAPYVAPGAAEGLVDHWYEKVPQPRAFEWNILHHSGLVDACMDIDGVLCRDPLDDENDDGPAYTGFLRDVPPRLVPASEVGWLVTSRLERYRPETEEWLARHGIRYRELVMHAATSAEQRRRERSHATHKAAVYTRTRAWLFIESDLDQAVEIADAAKRPVYCTGTRTMVYPGVPVGAPPRARDTVLWRLRERARMQRKRVGHWRRRLRRAVPAAR